MIGRDKVKQDDKENLTVSMTSLKSSEKGNKREESSQIIINESILSKQLELKQDIHDERNSQISKNSKFSFNYKINKITDLSTSENKSPSPKKKLGRRFMSKGTYETEQMMTSFKEGLNESSIKFTEEKDGVMITCNENSFLISPSRIPSKQSREDTLSKEDKLRNLVRRTLPKKKAAGEDSLFSTTAHNINSDNTFSDSIIEIKNHSQFSNFELSKMLFDIIHSVGESKSTSTIVIPPRYISFPYLVINKNIRIKGSPGTLVEINNGLIIVSKENTNEVSVSISECSFVFNLEVSSFLEKNKKDEILKNYVREKENKYHVSLFILMQGCFVEISDCDFRAIVHEDENIFEENDAKRLICETLFDVRKSELNLQSTICSNVYKILEADERSAVTICQCHLSEVADTALCLYNPSKFDFINSTIKNSFNAINIVLKEVHVSNALFDGRCSIRILNSDLSQNKNYGICVNLCKGVFNNTFNNELKMDILIFKNILKQNKKAILFTNSIFPPYLKEINFSKSKIDIKENEIKYNLEGGVEFSTFKNFFEEDMNLGGKVNDYNEDSLNISSNEDQEFNIVLSNNLIKDNKNSFGLKIKNLENFKFLINDNIFNNNLDGISITECKSCLIKMTHNQANENLDYGLNVINSIINIFMLNCKVNKNSSFGISLNNKTNMVNSHSTNKINQLMSSLSYIKNSEVSNNKKGGIKFSNFSLSVDTTSIQDNGQWAIEIPLENNRPLIKLLNYEVKMLNSLINGPIGGSWGLIENKKSICANGTCSIL